MGAGSANDVLVSKDSFTLRYLARTAAGVPRDLANTLVVSKLKPIRPTVLIYNCTWVCDARCEMCNNWKHGDRKSDMTLDAARAGVMSHRVLGRRREPEHLRRRADHAQRPAGDGRAVPPPSAADAQDRHQHDRPDAAPRDPDAHAHRRSSAPTHDLLISIRVSLDGIGDIHDQVRHVKSGFDKACQTIEAMQALAEKHPNFQFGIAVDDLRDQPRGRRRTSSTWARDQEARHRVQHAAVHRRHAEQQGARGDDRVPRARRSSSCGSSSSSASQEESVLSGQAFLYLHYADMIANGYQRTMPCPFQTQGLLLNPVRRPATTARTRRRSATCSTTPAEELYFKAENLAHREDVKNDDLPDLPEPVPGERRRDEAVRAVREVPRARVPGQARPRPAPRDAARTPCSLRSQLATRARPSRAAHGRCERRSNGCPRLLLAR